MLGRRVAKNMKKGRRASSRTKPARKATSAGNGSGASAADRKAEGRKSVTKVIDRLFAQERWADARAVLAKELAREPDSHWLRARLSTTYYEELNYDRALEEVEEARRLAPDCPLVLWEYAGTLDA